jgi:hypothetical protein
VVKKVLVRTLADRRWIQVSSVNNTSSIWQDWRTPVTTQDCNAAWAQRCLQEANQVAADVAATATNNNVVPNNNAQAAQQNNAQGNIVAQSCNTPLAPGRTSTTFPMPHRPLEWLRGSWSWGLQLSSSQLKCCPSWDWPAGWHLSDTLTPCPRPGRYCPSGRTKPELQQVYDKSTLPE